MDFQISRAAIGKGVVRPGFAIMTFLIKDATEVVAVVFQQIHVKIALVGIFFTQNNCVAWMHNKTLFDAGRIQAAHISP